MGIHVYIYFGKERKESNPKKKKRNNTTQGEEQREERGEILLCHLPPPCLRPLSYPASPMPLAVLCFFILGMKDCVIPSAIPPCLLDSAFCQKQCSSSTVVSSAVFSWGVFSMLQWCSRLFLGNNTKRQREKVPNRHKRQHPTGNRVGGWDRKKRAPSRMYRGCGDVKQGKKRRVSSCGSHTTTRSAALV